VLVTPCFAPHSSHGGVALRHPSNDPYHPALRASSLAPNGARAPFLQNIALRGSRSAP